MRPLFHLIWVATLAAAVTAGAAKAEIKGFTPGMFVMITARYDAEANRFDTNVAKGERTSCFEVLKVSRTKVTLSLVGGIHKPWWSDVTYQPGDYTDTWFSSTTFQNKNPNARPLAELLRVFTQVQRCPAKGTG